jgi:osmotically inducible lipoprotein OsmB
VTKMLVAAIAVALSYPLAGRYSPTERAIGGPGGAGIGAALSNGSTTGTLAGAAIGAASGAATAPPPPASAEWGWNDYGRRACIAYY